MVNNKVGRRSFGKFNPSVEVCVYEKIVNKQKLCEEKATETRKAREKVHQNKPKQEKINNSDQTHVEENVDVSVAEMAQHMSHSKKFKVDGPYKRLKTENTATSWI